jgi:AcrR family transcriptional regulator
MTPRDPKVKTSSYDAELRQARSAETKQRIVEAARELFLEDGYRSTTMAGIAKRARVNVDTVYELVGRKHVLLRELIEQAISGVDHAVVAEERAHIKAMRLSTDPVEKLTIYAHAMRKTHARLAPLFLALRDASSTESEARDVWREINDRRAVNIRKFIRDLRHVGGLRSDLSIESAADVVWVINSSELYSLFTKERGWSPNHYERWLADTMCRLLIPKAPVNT